MIDLTIHRIRNLSYHPKAILCFATTPPSAKHSFLALSRDNGEIELKSVNQKFRTISHVPGYQRKKVNAMAWIGPIEDEDDEMYHLVGGSDDGTVFLVDFSSGKLANIIPSDGGAVLSITKLKSSGSASSPVFAVGCEDGSIKIFQLQDDKSIALVSSIPSTGAPILSLAWRNESDKIDGSTLYAASDNGIIRRYDCKKSGASIQWKSTVRITLETRGRSTPTKVWTMQTISNGTLITGDSLGNVHMWDGETGTLEQSFVQNDSRADVLSLDVTQDELKIFASGVHSRVVCIERAEKENKDEAKAKWILTNAQRPHTHDVTSVAVVYKKGRDNMISPVLCTGGFDTKLCTYSVKSFQKVRPRTLYPWPSMSPVSLAPGQRCLLMRRENQIELYELAKHKTPEANQPIQVAEEDLMLGSLVVDGQLNLMSSTINPEGSQIALCDGKSISIFDIEYKENDGSKTIMPRKVSIDSPANTSAVHYTKEGLLVAATSDGLLFSGRPGVIVEESPDIFPRPAFGVSSICSNDSGSFVAVVCEEIDNSCIHVYRRSEKDGLSYYRKWWTISNLKNYRSVASFLPGDQAALAIASLDFELSIFDVATRTNHEWTRKSIEGLHEIPIEIRGRKDHPVALSVNPSSPNKVLISSFGAFAVFDIEREPPSKCLTFPEEHVRGRKRKRSLSGSGKGLESKDDVCGLCLSYNSMIFFGFLDKDEMVVVEQPWLNVVSTFPEALQQKVYGT